MSEPENPTPTDNRAELEAALREALEPFAAIADDRNLAEHPDSYAPRPSRGRPNMADFRRAQKALAVLSSPPSDQERGLEEADVDNLLSRLRACHAHNTTRTFHSQDEVNPDGPEAADYIERLCRLPKPTPPTIEHAAPQAVLLMVRSWVNTHTDSCASQSQIATTDGFRVECICDLPSRLLAVDQAIAALSPSSATEGRERIVAWLREQAKAIDPARNSNGARKFLWESAADAIERGEVR